MEDEETQEAKTFEIDGEKVTEDELKNGYKFAKANHERAEALKREREALEAERQAWRAERVSTTKVNEQMVETLRGFRPKEEPVKAADPYPVFDRVKSIDLLGDAQANDKIAGEIQAFGSDLETRIRRDEAAKRQQEMNALRAEFDHKLAQETGRVKTQLVMETAREKAQRENDETFTRTLKDKFGDLQLAPDELADVKKHYQAQVMAGEFGNFDEAGQWRYKPEAVEAGFWASPKGRQVLLSREKAGARVEGMVNRVRGESATQSTPTRSTRQTGGGDDALVNKIERINQGLQAGVISREQALSSFTDAEMKRYTELRSSTRDSFRVNA